MLRIAIFVSGGGSNLQNIIDDIQSGDLKDVKIARVVASKTGTLAEQRAIKHRIPVSIFVNSDSSDTEALLAQLAEDQTDMIVLAGYLQKINHEIIRAFPDKIINIHPALLPKHGGVGMYGIRPHEAVLAAGEQTTGATVHTVNEEYDKGKILLQKEVKVFSDDTAESLQTRVMLEAERVILPQVIQEFALAKKVGTAPFAAGL
ncbi:MAG TPA: phosphoribosylglycinamide formyltransferase [Clostridiaceae bacterium]|nr:phosphoribosylglycinamide formyltransferase [Clostridiaceae bacterium]